ncbi:hypothetical protein Tco_0855528, partial [Tanacetum coccineum]
DLWRLWRDDGGGMMMMMMMMMVMTRWWDGDESECRGWDDVDEDGDEVVWRGRRCPRWSVTTATKGDTLQGSARLQGGVLQLPQKGTTATKGDTRRVVTVETTTSNALVSCDGLGVLTLRYLLSSSSCLENVKILKEQNEQLLKDLRTSKLNAITYKTGLESVEARLLVYKKNEFVYEEDIKVLKREIHLRKVAIIELRRKLDLAQKQKDEIQLTVDKFENSSNSLSKLIDCQIVDNLEEFVNEPIVSEPTTKKPIVETREAKTSVDKPKVVRKNNGAPIIKDWVSDSKEEDVPQAKIQKKTVKPSFAKIEFVKFKKQVKSPRKTIVKQGNQNRMNTHSPRGNQRNWNHMMSQRLGTNFEMINKACHVCGSFDHLQYDCDNHQRQFNNKKIVKPVWNYTQRVNHQNFSRMTHPSPKRNMVPKAVLMRNLRFCRRVSSLGRIVGIKRLHDVLEVTAAQVRVTAAKSLDRICERTEMPSDEILKEAVGCQSFTLCQMGKKAKWAKRYFKGTVAATVRTPTLKRKLIRKQGEAILANSRRANRVWRIIYGIS